MEDLSRLAEGSMWPTSQAAGNMMSGRQRAMSAPGSAPTDPLPPEKDQGEPAVEVPDPVAPGSNGKPRVRAVSGNWRPPAPGWSAATTGPGAVRASN